MLRMSDDAFVNDGPNKDTVVAIRIHNGEYYFLGWMEDSENYDMQIANHPERNLLSRDCFWDRKVLYEEITSCDGYNDVTSIKDSEHYMKFLSYIRNYERNGKSDENDHDIFQFSEGELLAICDALKDGDYVFVITEE